MTLFQGTGLLFTLVAIFGCINHRFIKLPDTIGITAVGLMVSLTISLLGTQHPEMVTGAQALMATINFPELVFHGLLGLLLFAGSLHVDISRLKAYMFPVIALATVGVLISTFVVGFGVHWLTAAMGHPVSLMYCLMFGALISPTDPIAVLSILKSAGASTSVETKITGEALFNDGTAVVAFVTLLGLATGATEFSASNVAWTLAREVIGAIVLGVAAGLVVFVLLKTIDSYAIEIMLTLSLATGGYALAEYLHVSAPLAVVVMGLMIGNHSVKHAMSEKTREHLFSFWDLLDEMLNLVLFSLIGLEVIALALQWHVLWIGILAVPIVLLARFLSVALPLVPLRRLRAHSPHSIKIMTWGGLRGGISLALALSLPNFEGREIVIGMTYVVVLFSLLVQATTLGPYVKHLSGVLKNVHESPPRSP